MKLFISDHLQPLTKKLAESLSMSLPLTDLLTPSVIVVENRSMMEYLKFELTRNLGVAANLNFPFPFRLIDNFKHEFSLPPHNLFHPCFSRWIFSSLIKEVLSATYLSEKKSEEGEDDLSSISRELDRYQFGFKLAYLFDQYDFFRSDRLAQWSKQPADTHSDHWQSSLWRMVCLKISSWADENSLLQKKTRREEIQEIAEEIKRSFQENSTSVRKISFFGLSHQPAVYLDFLNSIDPFFDIDVYQLDLGERLKKRSTESKQCLENLPEDSFEFYQNLGRQAIDYWEKLTSLQALSSIVKVEPSVGTIDDDSDESGARKKRSQEKDLNMLSLVRSLIDQDPERSIKTGVMVKEKLQSEKGFLDLQIHNCPNRLREVEILKNNLLSLLEKKHRQDPDQTVDLNRILILAPNIQEYLSHIEVVFSRPPELPYCFPDQRKSTLVFFKAVEQLFDLFQSHFESSKLEAILNHEIIQERWHFSLNEIELVGLWLKKAGYRWGREDRKSSQKHSLKAGIRKLVDAYFHPTEFQEDHATIHLERVAVGVDADRMLGKMFHFLQGLLRFDQEMKQPAGLSVWIKRIKKMIEFFFLRTKDGALEERRKAVWFQLDQLDQQAILTEHKEELHPTTFQWILSEQFSLTEPHDRIKRGITFASISSVRSIPFEAVAVLGLGENFPRRDDFFSFNLMEDFRKGDRSKEKSDQLLFLEVLLMAEEFLHLSFIGRSPVDHTPLPPTNLVDNLIFSLARFLKIPPQALKEKMTMEHSLHRLEDSLTQPLFFYQPDRSGTQALSDLDSNLKRRFWSEKITAEYRPSVGSKEVLESSSLQHLFERSREMISFLSSIPTEEFAVEVDSYPKLKYFFKSPFQFFVQKVLKMNLQIKNDAQDVEDFEMNGLNKYFLFQKIKQNLNSEISLTDFFNSLKGNRLPDQGVLEENDLERIESEWTPYFLGIQKLIDHLEQLPHELPSRKNNPFQTKNFKVYQNHSVFENWTFDFNRCELDADFSSESGSPYLFVSIDEMLRGHRIYHRYHKMKLKDWTELWIDHVFLSSLPDFKGSWVLKESEKSRQKTYSEMEILFWAPLNEEKVRWELDKIALLIKVGKQLPLPFFDKLNNFVVRLFDSKEEDFSQEKILELLQEEELFQDQSGAFKSFCYPENTLPDQIGFITHFQAFFFDLMIEQSQTFPIEKLGST